MKKSLFYLSFLFFSFFSPELVAQGWLKIYQPDSGYSELREIYPTQDNGFILIGGQRNGNVNDEVRLIKVDSNGTQEWIKNYFIEFFPSDQRFSIQQTTNGQYIVGNLGSLNNDYYLQLMHLNATGDSIWSVKFPNGFYETGVIARETYDGGFIIAGSRSDTSSIPNGHFFLGRTDAQGMILWTKDYDGIIDGMTDMIILPDTGYLMIGNSLDGEIYSIRTDQNGDTLWTNRTPAMIDVSLSMKSVIKKGNDRYLSCGGALSWGTSIVALHDFDALNNNSIIPQQNNIAVNGTAMDIVSTTDGHFILTGETALPNGQVNNGQPIVFKMDSLGQIIWQTTLNLPLGSAGSSVIVASDGFIYIGGSSSGNFFLAKLTANGQVVTNLIQGNLFNDTNLNCTLNTNETGLKNWIVSANNNQSIFYGITDSLGNYSVQADTGTFNLMVHPPNNYWQSCTTTSVNFTNFYDTTSVDIGVQPVVNCPELQVSISTPFLRRCFDNTYTVSYCNNGTITAQNAYIEIDFDTFLIVNSSSIPWTTQTGNVFTFPIGNVSVGQCGTFTISVLADCNAALGQTHCVTAHAYPDTICTLPTNWSGANVEVAGTCLGDSIQFKIENTGIGNMGQSQTYLVVEDHVILRQGVFQLNAGDSTGFNIQTNGSTYRLIAHQAPNHPYSTQPTIALEGCTTLPNFSMGFVTSFYEDDDAAFIDVDCQQNIGAYDPNDKRGFPKGNTNEHYILKNTDINYHIRFQNTGTDTAFTVVIRDTIDTQTLDLAKIEFGTSSHSYAVDIVNGNTLKFTFNNIMLPDSNVNEPASHGFVKFRIPQQLDLPNGTLIENSAAIYFDFNKPVITNVAYHTIGQTLVNTEPIKNYNGLAVKIFPNPFINQTTFQLEDQQSRDLELQIFDAMGRIVHQEQFYNTHQFTFYNSQLTHGIYFYTLTSEGQLINRGKMMVGE